MPLTGWLYGMELDLYKSWFLDGCPDGIWYKNETIQARVSNCMHMCLIFFVLNVHIPLYLGSRRKPFFRTSKFFLFFSSSFNYINLYKFCELQIFYFQSLNYNPPWAPDIQETVQYCTRFHQDNHPRIKTYKDLFPCHTANAYLFVPKTYVDINEHIYVPKTYVRH